MNKFPCTSCGACCRRLNLFPKEILSENNLVSDETGRCSNLMENNLCRIYDDRPDICVVNHKKFDIDPKFYYETVASLCNTWMDEDNSTYERVSL